MNWVVIGLCVLAAPVALLGNLAMLKDRDELLSRIKKLEES